MKIYHTETQADYDALMVELERQRIRTLEKDFWEVYDNQTAVFVHAIGPYGDDTAYGSLRVARQNYPDVPITKYKAKADEKMKFTKENVGKLFSEHDKNIYYSTSDLYEDILELDDTPEKVVVPKLVAEWIESKKYSNIWKMIDDLRNGNSLEKSVINWLRGEYSKYGLSDQFDLLSLIKIYGYTIEPEQLYYIPLPYLETTDGIQQVLSKRKNDTNYFASRPASTLQQRYTKEELEQVPEVYKPYAKPIEEEEE